MDKEEKKPREQEIDLWGLRAREEVGRNLGKSVREPPLYSKLSPKDQGLVNAYIHWLQKGMRKGGELPESLRKIFVKEVKHLFGLSEHPSKREIMGAQERLSTEGSLEQLRIGGFNVAARQEENKGHSR